jgi:hypothetical protein
VVHQVAACHACVAGLAVHWARDVADSLSWPFEAVHDGVHHTSPAA